ncbi:unnamed protein product [Phaedon cochleariae]|uniref:Uncharacterized protein n=1 Tax=Phaedon cochleariae TaxID=80249 RepID=A0A9N9SED4_PHACE|nr:unnamed protein product [Phaedon cochleariae]
MVSGGMRHEGHGGLGLIAWAAWDGWSRGTRPLAAKLWETGAPSFIKPSTRAGGTACGDVYVPLTRGNNMDHNKTTKEKPGRGGQISSLEDSSESNETPARKVSTEETSQHPAQEDVTSMTSTPPSTLEAATQATSSSLTPTGAPTPVAPETDPSSKPGTSEDLSRDSDVSDLASDFSKVKVKRPCGAERKRRKKEREKEAIKAPSSSQGTSSKFLGAKTVAERRPKDDLRGAQGKPGRGCQGQEQCVRNDAINKTEPHAGFHTD